MRQRKYKACVICGGKVLSYYSKTCSNECKKGYRTQLASETEKPCVFTPELSVDYNSMIATLQKKGFAKVETLTARSAFEYTEKEGSISWWDKPPKESRLPSYH